MRISDWSSDVCSSDLQSPKTNGQTTERSRAAPHRQCYRHQIATIVAVDSYTERQSGDGEENAVGKTRQKTKRSEEHTSELQSLMRISYAVFCLKKKKNNQKTLNIIN